MGRVTWARERFAGPSGFGLYALAERGEPARGSSPRPRTCPGDGRGTAEAAPVPGRGRARGRADAAARAAVCGAQAAVLGGGSVLWRRARAGPIRGAVVARAGAAVLDSEDGEERAVNGTDGETAIVGRTTRRREALAREIDTAVEWVLGVVEARARARTLGRDPEEMAFVRRAIAERLQRAPWLGGVELRGGIVSSRYRYVAQATWLWVAWLVVPGKGAFWAVEGMRRSTSHWGAGTKESARLLNPAQALEILAPDVARRRRERRIVRAARRFGFTVPARYRDGSWYLVRAYRQGLLLRSWLHRERWVWIGEWTGQDGVVEFVSERYLDRRQQVAEAIAAFRAGLDPERLQRLERRWLRREEERQRPRVREMGWIAWERLVS